MATKKIKKEERLEVMNPGVRKAKIASGLSNLRNMTPRQLAMMKGGGIKVENCRHKHPPLVDRHGNQYWGGVHRPQWDPGVLVNPHLPNPQNKPQNRRYPATTCQLRLSPNCNGQPETLDHNPPWIVIQNEIDPVQYCDGQCHFRGVLMADAIEAHSHATVGDFALVNNFFQLWSCRPCNSHKGNRTLRLHNWTLTDRFNRPLNVPERAGNCPGAGCGL